ncbi:baculovirus repeated namegeneORF [Condylorrhiza vestigialis mutiple nucleopolyhedrovirus]|uniref:Baculovirus repeated namegeneORF n=1 Tax=Condylorrhiza vestigialis mutiple nucleopolyhedrovirus TaxID=1592576 RepID=A0A0B4UM55_9ABAC|nr:baculovirus repeated namegeneORF [Condylorrhiza vestigialis mutiple nucleopolyhedrovirus]AJD09248.1 baculovirus repeated namegeneORF [Condylorrhiza vestigialis mutiple nucleopolyhedrovirus]
MAQVKIGQFKFGEDTFTLRYVLERDHQVKFVAKDIADKLNYQDTKKAVKDHVDDKYKSAFEQERQIAPLAANNAVKQGDPLYLHPSTVLITKEGVIQLIMKSKLPYAVELQAWLLEEVIPQVLCTGKYAPAIKMETNETLSTALIKSNADLAQANANIIEISKGLIAANERNNALMAQTQVLTQALIAATERSDKLANRMADIVQDVVAKPNDPRLLHSLAVCDLGGDQFAFVRPQRRSLQRSLNKLSVGERNIVFRSDYVPNSVNVLNKVKESLPRDKFKAKHNKITLLDNLTKEQLVEAVQASMTERQIARLTNNMQR